MDFMDIYNGVSIPTKQLDAAWRLAGAHSHEWPQHVSEEDISIGISAETIRQRVIAASSPDDIGGIPCPELVLPKHTLRDCGGHIAPFIIHRTGSLRLRWTVRDDGATLLEVSRPDPCEGRIAAVVHSGDVVGLEAHGPLHWRHWASIEQALRALEVAASQREELKALLAPMLGDDVTHETTRGGAIEWSWRDGTCRISRIVGGIPTGLDDPSLLDGVGPLAPMGRPVDTWEFYVGGCQAEASIPIWRGELSRWASHGSVAFGNGRAIAHFFDRG